jgi:hypothetical protein
MEVLKAGPADEACLFCCQLTWVERESRLRHLATQIDGPIYWLANLIGTDWNPPWRYKRFAGGDVFTSNVGVATYFSRVYCFTHSHWLEEQRLAQKRDEELLRRPGLGFGRIQLHTTAEEQIAFDGRSAFTVFCSTSTNLVRDADAGSPVGDASKKATESEVPGDGSHR